MRFGAGENDEKGGLSVKIGLMRVGFWEVVVEDWMNK